MWPAFCPNSEPFVRQLWASLYKDCSRDKVNSIFQRQVWPALSWLRRFHEHNADDVVRHLYLVDRQLDGMVLEVDASTTRGGAVCWFGARRLSQQGPPNAFVATSVELKKTSSCWGLSGPRSSSNVGSVHGIVGQYGHFVTAKTRGRIVLVGDALGVWFGLIKMAAKSTKVNDIAQEWALHLAPLGHDLNSVHVWSEVYTTADALSRMAEHGQVPQELQSSRREVLGPRGRHSVDILEFVKRRGRKMQERPRAHECPRTGSLR